MSSLTKNEIPYTAGHQRRVPQLACANAREIDLSEKQLEGHYLQPQTSARIVITAKQEEIIVAFKIDDYGQGFDLDQVQCHRAKDRRLELATMDERTPHGRQPEDLKCQKHGDQHCL